MGRRPSMLICYHFFAHYREAVLRELSSRLGRGNLTLVADTSAGSSRIPAIPEQRLHEISVFRHVRNRYLGKVLLQAGILGQVFRLPTTTRVVLLGDAKYLTTWMAALIYRARGGKVFFWTHGTRRPLLGLRGLILRLFYSLPHGLLLYGRRGQELLQSGGVNTPASVIYNSLDFERQRRIAARLGPVVRDASKVLFCARLTKNKKADLLIDAVATLRDRGRFVRLDIVGDGPLRDSLEEQVRAHGLYDRINFLGGIYDELQLALVFSNASALVVPEAAGLSVMHAMGYGLPVVTSDDELAHMPESEAIVSGVTGCFFERGNVESLANSIIECLDDIAPYAREACLSLMRDRYCASKQASAIMNACFVER